MNPNKNTPDEVLRRLKEESYERLRANIFESVRQQLDDFGMTWDDLAETLKGIYIPINLTFNQGASKWERTDRVGNPIKIGQEIKKIIGSQDLTVSQLNDIAHAFSAEVYVIFRPRPPYTKS